MQNKQAKGYSQFFKDYTDTTPYLVKNIVKNKSKNNNERSTGNHPPD